MDLLDLGRDLDKKGNGAFENFLDLFQKELQKQVKNNETISNDFRKEGEKYEVDEIGDDEKYVFLTRESDGENMQEFEISDTLYNELLNDKSEKLELIYQNGEYKKI